MRKSRESKKADNTPPLIRVSVAGEELESRDLEFQSEFSIGRDEGCDIRLDIPAVSRRHAEVQYRDGRWWFKDLESANGSYIGGKKVREVPLGKTRIELGLQDAVLEGKS